MKSYNSYEWNILVWLVKYSDFHEGWEMIFLDGVMEEGKSKGSDKTSVCTFNVMILLSRHLLEESIC